MGVHNDRITRWRCFGVPSYYVPFCAPFVTLRDTRPLDSVLPAELPRVSAQSSLAVCPWRRRSQGLQIRR
jgi:hypothetical protein